MNIIYCVRLPTISVIFITEKPLNIIFEKSHNKQTRQKDY